METITVKACAKINLALAVLGKRPDGYHEIDTVMQSIDLADRLLISKSRQRRVYCPQVEQDNVALHAMELFFRESKIDAGATVEIEKHIPVSAGLGGGSADAAATLCALNRLYATGFSSRKLCNMAAALGADIPYFILGGTVRAKGFGEQLTPLSPFLNAAFVLFLEGNKPSTAEMYHRLDHQQFPQPQLDAVVRALEKKDLSCFLKATDNSFSPLWKKTQTEILLLNTGAEKILLSGSGPTRFAVFKEENRARAAVKRLQSTGVKSFFAKPTDHALFFE